MFYKILEQIEKEEYIKAKELCLEAIRADNNKAVRPSIKTGINAIITSAKKNAHNDFNGGFIQGDYQYITDGYRMVRLNNHIDLPVCKGFERPEKFFQLQGKTESCTVEFDLKLLKQELKIRPNKQKVLIKVFDKYFNPKYLIDGLNILGETLIVEFNKGERCPLMLKSEIGEYFILPVRVKADCDENLLEGEFYREIAC